MRYFVAGNFWLFFTFALHLGRTYERHSPYRVSFYGAGRWFTSGGYTLMVLIALAISFAMFYLCWKSRQH